MNLKTKILIGILVVGIVAIGSWFFYVSKEKTIVPPMVQSTVIPTSLLQFVPDLIPKDYNIFTYYYQFFSKEKKHVFYFEISTATSKEANTFYEYRIAPRIILFETKTLEEFEANRTKIEEFSVGKFNFFVFEDEYGEKDNPECVTILDDKLLIMPDPSYVYGTFKDCRDFIKSVLSDDFHYKGSLNFSIKEKVYVPLSINFQDCSLNFLFFKQRKEKIYTTAGVIPLSEMAIKYQCDEEEIHISILPSEGRKYNCCLSSIDVPDYKGWVEKFDGLDVCIDNDLTAEQRKFWKYEATLNTKDYLVRILSKEPLKWIERVDDTIDSQNIGFNLVKDCCIRCE